MWSGKEEDYYYCRMSPRRLLLQDFSWRGLLLQDAFLSMVGAADSQLKGMALQRQKVLTTLNLEIVKHTHTHAQKQKDRNQ
jgi:hypothetical protein